MGLINNAQLIALKEISRGIQNVYNLLWTIHTDLVQLHKDNEQVGGRR